MSIDPPPTAPLVDIVVPAYNEGAVLAANVTRLHQHLSEHFEHPWQLTIAENASTDDTLAVAHDLAAHLPRVRVLHLAEQGRGRALREAWTTSDAEIVAYMDADLSTDLTCIAALIDPIVAGDAHLTIGSRLIDGATVHRAPAREGISRAYNAIVRTVLRAHFHDAQCGFKAVRRADAVRLLPQVADQGWFFDTELLLVAQRAGLAIAEVPVAWVEDPDSSVRILPTAIADLRGVLRMTWTRHPKD